MILANRMGFSYTWMAFIPIADKYLLAKMGGRNFWKIFASFVLSPIPTVGFIFDLIFIFEVFCCWCNVSNYFGKKWYWAVLLFMPIVNFFVMGILIYQTKNHLNDTSYSR